ncbi:MAG: restriction endonuclease subunit S [Gammaproteobacteria bacterium]|nr:restriction endonuclease subunit S [Gammaproteobacteria bacterium]
MSADWPMVCLGNYCEKIGSGATPKGGKSVYLDVGETALIRSQNVYNEGFTASGLAFISEEAADKLRNVSIEPNDILLNITGDSVARVCMAPEEYLPARVNQHVAIIRPDNSRLDSRFVRYFLSSPEQQRLLLTIASSGATRNALTKSHIEQLEVPMPGLEIQQAIANQLETLDKKIKLNHQINQTLEQMAQAIFKSWFVDFDPVIDNAIAAGKDIPEVLQHKAEQRKQAQQLPDFKPLPDDIRELFPSEFEQTNDPSIGIAGWIPKGWRVSSTGDEFGIHGGSTPSTKNPDFWDGGAIHWTSPKDLSGNDSKILLDTIRKITEAGLAKITSGLLPIDTVLMSSRAPVGYLALAKVPLAINQGYIALQCEMDLTPEYTMQFLDSIMDEIKGISGGTTFAEISKKTFKSIKLVVPSKPAIDAFTAIAKANYDKITENLKQNNSLTETRDYLLPKLISGEITLENLSHE